MIEAILSGVHILAIALLLGLCFTGVVFGCMLWCKWLWLRNRVLGGFATVTCIVVVFLVLSYLIGSAVA